MYFLAENIIFNHNDVMQVICILLWIYNSILGSESENGYCKKEEERGWAESILGGAVGVLMNGPTIYMDTALNGYIMVKFISNRLKVK